MKTIADAITFLHDAAAKYDFRREVHVRNEATIYAAIASVQAATAAGLARELERLVEEETKPKESHRD